MEQQNSIDPKSITRFLTQSSRNVSTAAAANSSNSPAKNVSAVPASSVTAKIVTTKLSVGGGDEIPAPVIVGSKPEPDSSKDNSLPAKSHDNPVLPTLESKPEDSKLESKPVVPKSDSESVPSKNKAEPTANKDESVSNIITDTDTSASHALAPIQKEKDNVYGNYRDSNDDLQFEKETDDTKPPIIDRFVQLLDFGELFCGIFSCILVC